MRVHVVDGDGAPVADAGVVMLRAGSTRDVTKGGSSVTEDSGSTDAEGRFSFPVDEEFLGRVLVLKDGVAGLSEPLDTHGKGPWDLRIELAPEVRIRGEVRSAGVPLADARVSLESDIGLGYRRIVSTKSNADGRFELPAVPRDLLQLKGTLEAAKSGYGAAYQGFGGDSPLPEPLVFTLRPSVVITGRCVDENGAPIKGVWIDCSDVEGSNVSGKDGRFSFRTRADADKSIRTEHNDFASTKHPLPFRGAERLDLGDLELPAGLPIEGQVLLPDGTPVKRAFVFIVNKGVDQVVRQGSTDEEGRFRFEHIGPGENEVEASGTDPATGDSLHWEREDVIAGQGPLEIRLSAGLTIRLRFVEGERDEPTKVHKVEVSCQPHGDGAPIKSGTYSDRGIAVKSFRVKAAVPHDVTVTVANGESVVVKDVQVEADRAVEIPIRVR